MNWKKKNKHLNNSNRFWLQSNVQQWYSYPLTFPYFVILQPQLLYSIMILFKIITS